MKYLKISYKLDLTSFTVFYGGIKKKLCKKRSSVKKALKMTSQLVIFRAFFFLFFFLSPGP